jgi:hypothetical protein
MVHYLASVYDTREACLTSAVSDTSEVCITSANDTGEAGTPLSTTLARFAILFWLLLLVCEA